MKDFLRRKFDKTFTFTFITETLLLDWYRDNWMHLSGSLSVKLFREEKNLLNTIVIECHLKTFFNWWLSRCEIEKRTFIDKSYIGNGLNDKLKNEVWIFFYFVLSEKIVKVHVGKLQMENSDHQKLFLIFLQKFPINFFYWNQLQIFQEFLLLSFKQ